MGIPIIKILLWASMLVFANGCAHQIYRHHPFLSWKEIKENGVIMQKYDYSCGPAAMAHIMGYHFASPFTEKDFMDRANKILSAQEISEAKQKGLSMFNLKTIAESFGYSVAGLKIPFGSILSANIPVVIYVEDAGFKHFSVFSGFHQGLVHIADPSRGNLFVAPEYFAQIYQGKTLVLQQGGKMPPEVIPTGSPVVWESINSVRRIVLRW